MQITFGPPTNFLTSNSSSSLEKTILRRKSITELEQFKPNENFYIRNKSD